jgi:hypothetical protein
MVVLKVDIREWGSPVANQFNLRSSLYLVTYDETGKEIAEGQEAREDLDRL